jgi:pSer/pThr/pTyr-binding forkhead associated (FHA) protein
MDVRLIMFKESGDRREFPLSAPSIVIGRLDDCGIRIPLPEVSRRHVSISLAGTRVVVKDLGSANGTYVNNKRVTEDTLSAGDHLVVGPVVFTVQIDGKPEDIRPVKTRLRRRQASRAEALADSGAKEASDLFGLDEADEDDPISALEALASSADQTAIDPYDEEDED